MDHERLSAEERIAWVTVMLNFSPEEESRLEKQASDAGLPLRCYCVHLLHNHLRKTLPLFRKNNGNRDCLLPCAVMAAGEGLKVIPVGRPLLLRCRDRSGSVLSTAAAFEKHSLGRFFFREGSPAPFCSTYIDTSPTLRFTMTFSFYGVAQARPRGLEIFRRQLPSACCFITWVAVPRSTCF